MWEVMGADPVRAARFSDTMAVFASSRGFETSHVLNGYDWAALRDAHVVDVGGSRGHIAIPLAKASPRLRFTIQDVAATIAGADSDIPDKVADRVYFMVHDFSEKQPVVADVYFLRWILHNSSDKYCIEILRNLVPALRPGAFLLINEICLPQPGAIIQWREKQLRYRG